LEAEKELGGTDPESATVSSQAQALQLLIPLKTHQASFHQGSHSLVVFLAQMALKKR
jgi:hypothetical protein